MCSEGDVGSVRNYMVKVYLFFNAWKIWLVHNGTDLANFQTECQTLTRLCHFSSTVTSTIPKAKKSRTNGCLREATKSRCLANCTQQIFTWSHLLTPKTCGYRGIMMRRLSFAVLRTCSEIVPYMYVRSRKTWHLIFTIPLDHCKLATEGFSWEQ